MPVEDNRPPPLRLVCSDELGQLKVVQTADGAVLGTAALAATWGEPDKQQWIDCLAVGSAGGIGDVSTAVLAAARCSGGIDLLSPLTGELLGSIPAVPADAHGGDKQQEASRIRGLHLLWGSGGSGGSTGDAAPCGGRLPAVLSVTQGGAARLHAPATPADGARGGWEQQRGWQVPADVCCTAYDPASGRLAVGCQGAELRLFDVTTGELVFAFKGGKPNNVGLVDRPWNTALAFLPPAGGSGGGGAGDRLLVGTGYHKVRLYDRELGKRPQMDVSWGEGRVTALALEPDGQRCWVGNGLGQIEVLDLPSRRFSGGIRGLAGAVRALAAHPGAPVLASVGLDRYLRLHSTQSRQLLAKVYCKTLPTGLAFCPTNASMLPPPEEKPQQDERQQRRRRTAKGGRGGRGGSGEDSEDPPSEEEQEAAPQRKRSRRPSAADPQRGAPRRRQPPARRDGTD